MTEIEAIDWLKAISAIQAQSIHKSSFDNRKEALYMAMKALDKQIPKKPVCKEMPYSEEVGFNDEWYCPTCGAYVGYFTEGMNEPEQMEYCNECGQHIARDWSENYE